MSDMVEKLKLKIAKLEGKVEALEENNATLNAMFYKKLEENNEAFFQLMNKCNNKLEEHNAMINLLNTQLATLKKNKLILQVCSHIEELECRFLQPLMQTWFRFDEWGMILQGDIRDLKKNGELQRFKTSIAVDLNELIETIVVLYGELSNAAAHNINHPINYNKASIVEMLNKFRIALGRSKVDAMLLILRPL